MIQCRVDNVEFRQPIMEYHAFGRDPLHVYAGPVEVSFTIRAFISDEDKALLHGPCSLIEQLDKVLNEHLPKALKKEHTVKWDREVGQVLVEEKTS